MSKVTAMLGCEGVTVAAAMTALFVKKLLVKCHHGREGLQPPQWNGVGWGVNTLPPLLSLLPSLAGASQWQSITGSQWEAGPGAALEVSFLGYSEGQMQQEGPTENNGHSYFKTYCFSAFVLFYLSWT